jgi:hypothetical protein
MIDDLVVLSTGSFDIINRILRAEFANALKASRASMLCKFDDINSKLESVEADAPVQSDSD